MPVFHVRAAPGQPKAEDERDHSEVASETDVMRPAEALLHELAAEAEHIHLELAEIEAKDQAHAERKSHQVSMNPFETYRTFTEMFMDAFAPPVRSLEHDAIEGHGSDDTQLNDESSGITHAAVQKRAEKAWRTRRANAAQEEKRKAARRRAEARTGSSHRPRRGASA